MIEVSEVQHAIVVREVNRVDVPGDFLSIGNVVKVAHAAILSAEAAAGTDISGIGRPELVGENGDALARLDFDLPDDVFEGHCREDLFDRRRQIRENHVGIGAEVAGVADCREGISFVRSGDGEVCGLLALDRQNVEIVEAAVDSRWHFCSE